MLQPYSSHAPTMLRLCSSPAPKKPQNRHYSEENGLNERSYSNSVERLAMDSAATLLNRPAYYNAIFRYRRWCCFFELERFSGWGTVEQCRVRGWPPPVVERLALAPYADGRGQAPPPTSTNLRTAVVRTVFRIVYILSFHVRLTPQPPLRRGEGGA